SRGPMPPQRGCCAVVVSSLLCRLLAPPQPRSTLFPYTTLFRSYLRDIWPTPDEIGAALAMAITPEMFMHEYGRIFDGDEHWTALDRKSTRLNSSHSQISYAVFCLKKKITQRFLEKAHDHRRQWL